MRQKSKLNKKEQRNSRLRNVLFIITISCIATFAQVPWWKAAIISIVVEIWTITQIAINILIVEKRTGEQVVL